MKKLSFLIAMVVALSMVVLPYIGDGTALGAVKDNAAVTLKAGQIDGVLKDSQGAAVGKAGIKILDKNGSAITEVVTGQDGRFSFNCLTDGKYTLVVNDAYSVWFEVAVNGDSSEMSITLAEDSAGYSAGNMGSGGGSGFLSSPFVAGGIVATAVAVPVAIHNAGGPSCP